MRELAGALTAEGFDVFWDVTPTLGQSARYDLEAEIASAAAVIGVWSALSRNSNWVRDVAQEALDRGNLFPVLKDVDRPPLGFRQLRSADLRGWPEDPAASDALSELVAQLRERIPEAAAPAPADSELDFERSTIILNNRSEDASASFAAPTQGTSPSGSSRTTGTTGATKSIPRVAARTSSPGDLRAGDEIGQYKIIRRLGAGGFGAVYEAANIHNEDERVALKLLLADVAASERFAQLLKLEANALLRLKHPAVVQYRVFGRIADSEQFYLVTEFIPGLTLRDWRRKNEPTLDDVRVLGSRLAQGLAAAHRRGIVHRDLAPDNVIVAGDEIAEATLIDFGIARMGDADTLGTAFAGKFSYAAPEQFEFDGGRLGPSIDIYSFGLLIAAFVRGRPLDMGRDIDAARAKRATVPPLDDIPAQLIEPLTALLQPDPIARPRNMDEVALLFERIPNEAPVVAPPFAEAQPPVPAEAAATEEPHEAEALETPPPNEVVERTEIAPLPAWEEVQAGEPAPDVEVQPPAVEREKTIIVSDALAEPTGDVGVDDPPPQDNPAPERESILLLRDAPPLADVADEVAPVVNDVPPAAVAAPDDDYLVDDEDEDEPPPRLPEPEPERRGKPLARTVGEFLAVALVAAGVTYLVWPKGEEPPGPVAELPQPAPEPSPPPQSEPEPQPAPPIPPTPAPDPVPQPAPPQPEPEPEPEPQPPAPKPTPEPQPPAPQPDPTPEPPPETPPEGPALPIPTPKPDIPAEPVPAPPAPEPVPEPQPPTEATRATGAIAPAPHGAKAHRQSGKAYGTENDAARIVYVARRATTLKVVAGDSIAIDRALSAGDSYRLPDRRDLNVSAGDAGALDVILDGKFIGRAGPDGAELVGFAVTPVAYGGPDKLRVPEPAPPQPEPEPQPQPTPPPVETANTADQALQSLNAIRKANNAREVKYNDKLARVAQALADNSAKANNYQVPSSTAVLNLIIQAGYGNARAYQAHARRQQTVAAVFDGWRQRSDTGPSLVDPGVVAIGFGAAKAADGTPYWVLILAYPP